MEPVTLNGSYYTVQEAIDKLFSLAKESSPVVLTTAAGVVANFTEKERCSKTENFFILFVDHANAVTKKKKMSAGIEEQTVVYPRAVMRDALMLHATGIIAVHNHPTGNTTPSTADMSITKALKLAADTLDIRFLDHVIISKNGYFSFRENGLLS